MHAKNQRINMFKMDVRTFFVRIMELLFTVYLIVLGIIMPSLNSVGQF